MNEPTWQKRRRRAAVREHAGQGLVAGVDLLAVVEHAVVRDVVDRARDLERALAPGERERAARARGAGVLGDERRAVRAGEVELARGRGQVVLQHVADLHLGLQVAGLVQVVLADHVEVEARRRRRVGVDERVGVVEDVLRRVAIDDRAERGRVVQAGLARAGPPR